MVYGRYVGSYSSLDPGFGADYEELFTGYTLTAGRIGAPTSAQTANQIGEVEARLKEGMKTVELQPSPEALELIPKQQFKEINRIAKLANADITFHAPVMDPSGFTDKGWSETARAEAETRLMRVMEHSHTTSPEGNVPVTAHASAIPAKEWQKVLGEKGVEIVPEMQVIINQDTGEMTAVRREERFEPGMVKPKVIEVEKALSMHNATQWDNGLRTVYDLKRTGDDIVKEVGAQAIKLSKDIHEGKFGMLPDGKVVRKLPDGKLERAPEKEAIIERLNRAKFYYEEAWNKFGSFYHLAYKCGDKEQRKTLLKESVKWEEDMKNLGEKKLTFPEITLALGNMGEEAFRTLHGMRPKLYAPVEEFAISHASKTFGNVAFEAYKKYKEKAPVLSVENVIPNMAFSRAEQLKKLIKASRNKFVENAVKEGMHEEKAREISKKLIGVTWDVAHINLLRKAGYKEKELIKETELIAPFVKHVHVGDNFGFLDSHLPPGMGEVPIKKLMKKLEEEGYSGKAIMEANQFAQQFKTSPHPYVLEALGSPVYYPAMAPLWSQAKGMYGAYFAYGPFLPEQHFAMYGGGFSALPTELGGRAPGKGRQFAGTPME